MEVTPATPNSATPNSATPTSATPGPTRQGPTAAAGRRGTAPGRQLLGRDERRAQILGAAASAFVEEGYAATSIDDVAAAAGITKVIVYRHFAGNEELYRSILDDVVAVLAVAFDDANAAREDGPAAPAPSLVALLDAARAQPDAFRLLTVHAPREVEFRTYAELTRRGMEEATGALLEPLGADPELRAWLVALLVDAGVAAVLQWLDHGTPDRDDEFLRRSTGALRAMVQAATSGT